MPYSAAPHARVSMTVSATEAMQMWMDDAHYALDLGHGFTDSMVRALVATPEHPPAGAHDTPRTWYLEEYERVMRQQMRDPVPMSGPIELVDEWRQRQAQRSDRLAQLVDLHSESIALAHAFVARTDAASARGVLRVQRPEKAKGRRPGRRAADLALDALRDAA